MPARRAAVLLVAALALAVHLPAVPAAALDSLKVAVAQRGQWDTAITELGQRSGILAKRGIAVEILYTQGGPEAYQAVISGSMDIACGGGIESAVGGYAKGAPLRIIASAMIGSPDTYWFVKADSPIRSLRDAAGIKIVRWSYAQLGIVATVRHTKPHGGRAVQHFLPSGPFAILPLTASRSCVTWSEEHGKARAILARK